MCSTRPGDGWRRSGAKGCGAKGCEPRHVEGGRHGDGVGRGAGRTMPIMARRPFLISERRFSASCWELSFLVKPGVSQTATVRRRRRSEGMRSRRRGTKCRSAAEALVHVPHQIDA